MAFVPATVDGYRVADGRLLWGLESILGKRWCDDHEEAFRERVIPWPAQLCGSAARNLPLVDLLSMPPRVQRLTVLGLLAFLAERLAAEGNREALRTVKSLGSTADDDQLDDDACLDQLRRAWWRLGRTPLFDNPLLERDDPEEGIVDAAPLEAALDRIGQILWPDETA